MKSINSLHLFFEKQALNHAPSLFVTPCQTRVENECIYSRDYFKLNRCLTLSIKREIELKLLSLTLKLGSLHDPDICVRPSLLRLPDLRSVIVLDSRQPGMLHFDDVMQAGGSQHEQQLQDLQKKISFDDPINIQFTSVTVT